MAREANNARGPNRTTHTDCLWDFSKNKMDKIVAGREGKK